MSNTYVKRSALPSNHPDVVKPDTAERRLGDLAKSLYDKKADELITVLSPENRARLKQLIEGARPSKNVYQYGQSWRIAIFIGGKQRIIGLVNFHQAELAYRYADCAITYFWPYRTRRPTPEPIDDDLNFSLEQSKHDLDVESNMFTVLLDTFKALLTSEQLLEPPKAKEPTVWELSQRIDALVSLLKSRGIQ